MKKRGIFSLVVLLALSTLFAAQTTTDIGTAYELVISDVAFAQAETNNASSVSVITRAQIEAYNAQTTAELVNKAIGTNFNSYGALGALQNVVIRGASSSKNLIFLDGVLLSSAHDGTIDLSIIPVSTIERIEIIKSGSGNLGRTNAIGGMVNIITKQGEATEKPFSFTVENGSFVPEAYGSSADRHWLSLVDSQKLDVTYANTLSGTNLVANVGGVVAQNAYAYDNGTAAKALRDNAEAYEVHGTIKADRAFGENVSVSSNTLSSYKRLNLPGSYTWTLTPKDYQEDILVSTKNSATLANLGDTLASVKADINYQYGRTFFHDDDLTDSTHSKNKGNFMVEGSWNFGEAYNVVTGADFAFDYVDSTNSGKNFRFNPALYAHGSIYLLEGKLSLHPSASLAYLSDIQALAPNASFGAIFNPDAETTLKATISYAENPPTFTDLYWTGSGNSNLKTEKGLQGDFSYTAKLDPLTYEGTFFGRNIYNAIIWAPITPGSWTWLPYNIGHSVYFGTEQAVTLNLSKMFAVSASYLYNKSYDLSNGQTFSDNIGVSNVRKHTAKASASFRYNIFDAVISGEYLGKTSSATSENIFVLNLSVNAQITDSLTMYVALDNMLNASYELQGGYPMPGTKIRLGGNLKF
ncbi:MAG: TonB-dependent receptor [Spirochaetia bacterium]|nr:TonB-dependent receptor [Spirochaetia bacterium]